MGKIKVYLDNCCYNRPFDDQSQLRISLETQAKLFVQSLISDERIDLVVSYINNYENNNNPFENRKYSISRFSQKAKYYIVESNEILLKSYEITKAGIKPTDALHLASAIISNADFFLTVDDQILKYKTDEIKIMDPIKFVIQWDKETKNDD